MENIANDLILKRNTKPNEIGNELIVYHTCSFNGYLLNRIKNSNKNTHAGSKLQALWRADYKVRDEKSYGISYLYELHLHNYRLYPYIISDDGGNMNTADENIFKPKWDLLLYKNTGEGFVYDENLSVVILNPDIIKSAKLINSYNETDLDKLEDAGYFSY